jgi:hypothetical protein
MRHSPFTQHYGSQRGRPNLPRLTLRTRSRRRHLEQISLNEGSDFEESRFASLPVEVAAAAGLTMDVPNGRLSPEL